jgi:hypothetical protein
MKEVSFRTLAMALFDFELFVGDIGYHDACCKWNNAGSVVGTLPIECRDKSRHTG